MSEKEGYVVVFGCKRCGKCKNVCPVGAIYEENELAKIDPEKCNLCVNYPSLKPSPNGSGF